MVKNNAITQTKAVGILLVVMGHAIFSDTNFFVRMITMFHVPLFFFVSGYCLKNYYFSHPLDFVKRRIKGLYWPFVKWNVLFILLHNYFYSINIYNAQYGWKNEGYSLYSSWDVLKAIMSTVTKMSDIEPLLGAFWFLKPMLFASLISFFLLRFVRKYNKLSICVHDEILAIVAAFVLFVIVSHLKLFIPYFDIGSQPLYCACIFLSGRLFKTENVRIGGAKMVLLTVVLLVGGVYYFPMSLNQPVFNLYYVIPYWLVAVLSTWTVYSICSNFQSRALTYIGEKTMIIFTLHFLAFKLVSFLIILIYKLPIERLSEFYCIKEYSDKGWCVAYFLVGVVVPLSCSAFYDKILRIKIK